jgi:hypothetical protein
MPLRGLLCLVGLSVFSTSVAAATVTVVDAPDTRSENAFYVGNRQPLKSSPLIVLPIRSIHVQGWLRKQLELQAVGFHGHLGEISQFLKKDGNAWLDPQGSGSHGWEEPPYWLKGYGAAAYLLNDPEMIDEAKVWIEGALRSQKPDGWFGPDQQRGGVATRLTGREDLWPNMIMLFCLQDYYDFTNDQRVLTLMTNYFRYLASVPEDQFLLGYWPKMRGGDLLFSVYWLYNRTGDAQLLELAGKVHRHTARWDEDLINWHNVNISQAFGEPTTYWLQSQEPSDLAASYRNFDKIRAMYGQVPGGMFGSDENCRPGCDDPRQAVETCGMVEMMLSTETLTWITGDVRWADRCEDVAFNSLPAALTPDMRALRYLTSPNLAVSDQQSKSPGLQNGGPMLLMDPHRHRCCQHNWGHGWPYLARHLWFATPDDGLAAVFYSDSRVTAQVGDGVQVCLDQDTQYPFDEQVRFTVQADQPVSFPLYLRVPQWCSKPQLTVNDQPLQVGACAGRYLRVERRWADGDTVSLSLPMEIRVRRWAGNHGSVSVDRGPLTYSLKIGERHVCVEDRGGWDAFEIHPTTPWNYGLVLPDESPEAAWRVVRRAWPDDDQPFTQDGVPIQIQATGKQIPQWQLDEFGLVAELQDSPVESDQPEESITLIPMGAARLRISAFPVIGQGPPATRWQAPPTPAYRASASHCFQGDTVRAVADGRLPSGSDDQSIPRMTWWPEKGGEQWVQADFFEPREVCRAAVYWFDDTGRGGCRVPQSWRLLYRAGDSWQPVTTSGDPPIARDQFNEVTFTPVTTTAFRLVVQLQPEFSGGILEWKFD